MTRHLSALLALTLLLVSCSFAGQALPPTATPDEPIDTDQQLQEMGLLPTEAPTPQPTIIPTLTLTPESTATPLIPWEGWPTPVYEDPTTPEPYPAHPISLPSNVDSYLLLGSDWLSHRDSINTDAFMMVVVDSRVSPARADVFSIPRDLYVFIPGHGMGRINSAYAIGGEEMVLDTVLYNFGLPITGGYIYLEMASFVNFIDYLNGVDVVITANIFDECADGTVLNYLEGYTIGMNGRTALCYSRARMASNDFDRMRRQQEVVKAVLRESIERFGENPVEMVRIIVDLYGDSVETNMTFLDYVDAAWHAAGVDPDESLALHLLQPPLVSSWIKPSSGAYLLLPETSLRDWIAEAIAE